MNVHVKCFANLADAETCNYDGSTVYELDSGLTVTDLMHHIGVAPESVKLIFLNGKHAGADTVITDGDQIALAPATGGM
jgi:molybdopterin synthase sulfur carrier subunit